MASFGTTHHLGHPLDGAVMLSWLGMDLLSFSLLVSGAVGLYAVRAWYQVRTRDAEIKARKLDFMYEQLTFAREQHEGMMKIHAEQRKLGMGSFPRMGGMSQ